MRPIHNPFATMEEHNCFCCSPNHPIGLKLAFFEDGEWVLAQWKPDIRYTGYKNIIHGGIQSTLMDEVAAWVVYIKAATAGVTSRMEVRYRKPVSASIVLLSIRGKLVDCNRRIAKVQVEILEDHMQVYAEALVDYFLYSPEKAATELDYPGLESFFKP